MPWLREATRRNPNAVGHYNDCERCIGQFQAETRQALGCAYESPVDHAQAWQPEGYEGPAPKTCPGYTTKLPEVTEATEARFYLHRGCLSLLIRDELADNLREGIAILEGADAEVTSWAVKNQEK